MEYRISKVNRKSNFELLRIIAMILIIAHHFSLHGGFGVVQSKPLINRIWILWLQLGGKIGVNIFVLISGYFLVSSPAFKLKKVLKLWLQLFFYSIVIYAVFVGTGGVDFNFKQMVAKALPILTQEWWFASTYFILYLISPYLNMLSNKMEKSTYQKLLFIMLFLWCIIPTFTNVKNQSNDLIWFVYLYSIAGYIRLWGIDFRIKNSIVWAVLGMIAILFVRIFFIGLSYKVTFFSAYVRNAFDMQNLLILLTSVLFLIGFMQLDLGYKKIINLISSATFGVYLIHDHPLIRPFLWETLFKNASYAGSVFLIPYSIMVICVVYIVCTIIELIRINVLEKRYLGLLDNCESSVESIKNKIKQFYNAKIEKNRK